jgi:hypothetical protein
LSFSDERLRSPPLRVVLWYQDNSKRLAGLINYEKFALALCLRQLSPPARACLPSRIAPISHRLSSRTCHRIVSFVASRKVPFRRRTRCNAFLL